MSKSEQSNLQPISEAEDSNTKHVVWCNACTSYKKVCGRRQSCKLDWWFTSDPDPSNLYFRVGQVAVRGV